MNVRILNSDANFVVLKEQDQKSLINIDVIRHTVELKRVEQIFTLIREEFQILVV